MSDKALKEKIGAIEAEAAATVKRVFTEVPKKYHAYITLLEQSKKVKVAGYEGRASFEVPYVGVDGRVKMVDDEHRGAGKAWELSTEFVTVQGGSKVFLICKAVATSPIFGLRVGHAITTIDKTGFSPEATNPFEVAETSAVGRALGFAGYGLLGGGIASAEEVLGAIAKREKATKEDAPKGKAEEPKNGGAPPPASSDDYTPDGPEQGNPFPVDEKPKTAEEKAAEDPLLKAAQEAFPGSTVVGVNDLSGGEAPKMAPPADPITKKQVGMAKRRLKDKGITSDEDINKFIQGSLGVPTIEGVTKDKFNTLLGKIAEV